MEGRTDVVWGTVNDGPICHCVNARDSKATIGRGQRQLSPRVDLPHHELVSRLQERVKLQVSEKSAVDLHKLSFNAGTIPQLKPRTVMSIRQQSGKPTTLSTSKLKVSYAPHDPHSTHHLHLHCNSQLSAELSDFKFGQLFEG